MPSTETKVLTRQQLYDLVWAKPMSALAEEFHLSDVGLGKWCRKLDIPRPPRGYWQKLASGKKVRRPSLPRPDDVSGIEFSASRPDASEEIAAEAPPREIPAFERFELDPTNAIVVPKEIVKLHPLVAATKKWLKVAAHPNRDYWNHPQIDHLDARVSVQQIDRTILLLDTLVRALEKRGLKVCVEGERYSRNSFVSVGTHRVRFDLFESSQKGERFCEIRKEMVRDNIPCGVLVLRLFSAHDRPSREWRDKKTTRVEDCLNAFIVGVHEEMQVRDAAAKAAEVRRAEEHARWLREMEERKRQEEEAARVSRLSDVLARWREASDIRAFADAVEEGFRSAGTELPPESDLSSWLAWARDRADNIDPLLQPRFRPACD